MHLLNRSRQRQVQISRRYLLLVNANTNMRIELEKLEKIDKPTFWIDRENVAQLDYKVADRYQKFKARNIRLNMRDGAMRSQRKLVEARDLALGFDKRILFEGVNINLREGEAIELRGRNGAGKTTLIRALMARSSAFC
jgi:ATP-binding cassette, subfamily F, member 3